jgi:anaerobic ribonucleoside-triphosphate reductase activating protein
MYFSVLETTAYVGNVSGWQFCQPGAFVGVGQVHRRGSMANIFIATIIAPVYTDGPGERASVYFQGCSIRCPGCQSPHLWGRTGVKPTSVEHVARTLLATDLPVTILGGEPFDQPVALAHLVAILKSEGRHVIVYSGFTYEQLMIRSLTDSAVRTALMACDVLVDGPFVYQQDDAYVQYRGSRNQRPIDMVATRATERLALLDWDTPELIVTSDGRILATQIPHGDVDR